MSQFDLKKFLVENKLTYNSRLPLNERWDHDDSEDDYYHQAAQETRMDEFYFLVDTIYKKSPEDVEQAITDYYHSGRVDDFIRQFKDEIKAYLKRNDDYYTQGGYRQLPENILTVVAEDILELFEENFEHLPDSREPINIGGKTFKFNQ